MPDSVVSSSSTASAESAVDSIREKSTRPKVLSLKAKEARITELTKVYNDLCRTADKVHADTKDQLTKQLAHERLVLKQSTLERHLEQLDQVYDELRNLHKPGALPDSLRIDSDRVHSDQTAMLNQIKCILSQKTSCDVDERLSYRSLSCRTAASARSSSLSQKASEARIRAQSAKKQLEAQQEFDKMQREVEEKQRQANILKLRRQAEIEEEEAEELEKLAEEEADDNSAKSSKRLFLTSRVTQPERTGVTDYRSAMKAETAAREATPIIHDHALLAEALIYSKLPTPEPSVFAGDPLKYMDWETTFDDLIEHKTASIAHRMFYLKRYTAGGAREAISGYLLIGTAESYQRARTCLKERYGNRFAIADALQDRLDNWPKISGKGRDQLQKYADFLMQCKAMIDIMPEMAFLNTEREQRKIVQKLPEWLVVKWSAVVSDTRHSEGRYPDIDVFTKFLARQARIANEPMMHSSVAHNSKGKERSVAIGKTEREVNRSSFSTGAAKDEKTKARYSCFYCKDPSHFVNKCPKLQSAPAEVRLKYLKENKLCFSCMRRGHMASQCKAKPADAVPEQQAAMESTTPSIGDSEGHHSHTVASIPTERFSSAMIVPVWVSVKNQSETVMTYALLDLQSDVSFMTAALQQQLQARGEDRALSLSTMTSEKERISTQKVRNLCVKGVSSDVIVDLPVAYTRNSIPVSRSNLPSPEKALKWPHLEHLADLIWTPADDCHIGLLIGYDCPQALVPREVVAGTGNQPFAIRTDLGWSIVGRTADLVAEATSHRVAVTDLTTNALVDGINKDFVDETLEHLPQHMSQEDFEFLKLMKNESHQDQKGHWVMPLPLKVRPGPNPSYDMARKRLGTLQKKFESDEAYKSMYTEFMSGLITRGEAELVPDKDLEKAGCWYIPHFGVFHPKKPNKIRVVFDCAAKAGKLCLNDHLMQGPDMLNSLLGILLRFREKPIAIMADVERMFHQFKVEPRDRDFLRFLWEKDGEIRVYRMTVHLFGACSSPSCATFGMRAAASLADMSETDARRYIERDFYVDDGLSSVSSETEAIALASSAVELCARSGIRLHKFLSNSKSVMAAIAPENRAKETKDLDLSTQPLPKERALGVSWCVETDKFFFKVDSEPKPMTRRGVLSTISSVFDPLGLLSPYILMGKHVVQAMCRERADWDDPISEELRPLWEKWMHSLQKIDCISVPRHLESGWHDRVRRQELHYFCDASTMGYGACCYLKVVSAEGEVTCSLVLSKARVAPLKQTTIPRLELQAAVVASQLSETVRREMRFDQATTPEYYWTDSMVVLGYITNRSKRYSVYVANRVQTICDRTDANSWYHVRTTENPADHASRGMLVEHLNESHWFTGPRFLHTTDVYDRPEVVTVSQDDPEIRGTCLATAAIDNSSLGPRVERFSTLSSAKRAFATLLVRVKKTKALTYTWKECLDQAETLLLKWSQEDYLSKDGMIKLKKLSPFIDDNGLVRVGGRLSAATQLTLAEKHPVILPSDHHITRLVIDYHHKATGHGGKNATINKLRGEGYWIVHCAKSVMKWIRGCVICQRLRGMTAVQKMGDLPEVRIDKVPPFTHTGCDVFGPFEIREGRKTLKRYGCLFTCLYSRAVHLEVLDDMSSDSFINAFRCLSAQRGPVSKLLSDQGTNFKGAATECQKAFESFSPEVQRLLATERCEFIYNVPMSSHMGGVWERMIRTVRQVLQGLLLETHTRLNATGLRTLFIEAAAIVNSRPLSVDHITDPNEPLPITPNHLLTQKVVHPPMGVFSNADQYCNKRWRRVQYLADQFWVRWKREYLKSLQPRQKWTDSQQNIRPGTVIALEDANTLRGKWQLGLVLSTNAGNDGLVRTAKIRKLGESGKPMIVDRPIHKMKVLITPERVEDKL